MKKLPIYRLLYAPTPRSTQFLVAEQGRHVAIAYPRVFDESIECARAALNAGMTVWVTQMSMVSTKSDSRRRRRNTLDTEEEPLNPPDGHLVLTDPLCKGSRRQLIVVEARTSEELQALVAAKSSFQILPQVSEPFKVVS